MNQRWDQSHLLNLSFFRSIISIVINLFFFRNEIQYETRLKAGRDIELF
jgi:hypothetical protein